ncbi:protein phosphatase 2C [Angomonas deanei]|uniref:Protein phosphatase n=1 Tax=Angomonas deanei TaxID=59799 RepID=S9VCT4_9TRYP|nr:protein phosphatase 2C [Angomonas deanei]EPY37507.1 protein phosphatase 2C [Angomonas deanei]EPY38863.1 protein phosphatase 2C [Angomonas deanei]CAD2218848.1 Stage II sporulation protein E (SpoIIE), putative [Angomonas deanei]|eukprot:EPY24811.1 protein phosphatase 2C [Angomonas deanei]
MFNFTRRRSTLATTDRRALQFGQRGVCCLPHPEKQHRGGEDAFFSHPMALGVADGVGGMAKYGVDPAIFTRNIMRYCYEKISGSPVKPIGSENSNNENEKENTENKSVFASFPNLPAVELLTSALERALKDNIPGACPAVVVAMKEEKEASIVSLGDCGVVIVRGGRLLYRSTSQQHYFNCPYQMPNDTPRKGEQSSLLLQENDVLLLASDGVLDNVETDELVKVLANVRAENKNSCKEAADIIGQTASRNGHDEKFMSPFAKEAQKQGKRFRGGKLDDITALVARVTPLDQKTYFENLSQLGGRQCPRIIEEALGIGAFGGGSEKNWFGGFFNSKL